jgi:hypothetical protein
MLGRMGDTETIRETVEQLCTPPPRRAGTDAERRAANWLAERLREGGARVAIETTYVHPRWAAAYLVHCLVAIGGSLAATGAPAVGFALVLAAAASLYLDLSGRRYLLRLLFFRRASQNVISPPLDDAETSRVIISARYDTGPTGAAYNPGTVGAFERLRRILPVRTAPMAIVFWSIALLLPPLGLRLAGIEDGWVAFLQLPQTLTLIVAAFMLGEIALSPPSPGANANASGVAAALLAARRLEREPPEQLQVHILLNGAGEPGGEGLRWFMRHAGDRLPRDRTWLIALEEAGRGTPRYVAHEVPALTQLADPTLLGLCEALAEGDPDRARLDLGPAGGASLAAGQGYAAIAITAREGDETVPRDRYTPKDTPDGMDPAGVEGVAGFATDLVALLDREVGRRLKAQDRTDPPAGES